MRNVMQRWDTSSPSREIFLEMMAAAVLKNSSPNEMKMLSGLAGDRSTLPGWQRQALATAVKVHAGTGESAVAEESKLEPRDMELFAEGRQRYLTTCSGCHGTDGAGLPRFGPSLVGSEWVLGDERRLALILLHGMEGPIEVNGKVLDVPDILPVMPAHSVLGDREITAIMTYIRNEWGNNAGPVTPRVVGTIRHTTQGRVVPWTAEDLNRHMEQLEQAK